MHLPEMILPLYQFPEKPSMLQKNVLSHISQNVSLFTLFSAFSFLTLISFSEEVSSGDSFHPAQRSCHEGLWK